MLVQYGNFELFVINTQNNGLITMNALPLAFKYESENAGAVGNIMLPLDEAETIPKEAAELIEKNYSKHEHGSFIVKKFLCVMNLKVLRKLYQFYNF